MTAAVLACGDGVGAETTFSDDVIIVDELCRHPEAIANHVQSTDRLVLVLHPDGFSLVNLQTQLRAAGFDPLGVPIVDHAAVTEHPDGARVVLAGARARAIEYAGSQPEQAKPVFPDRMTRRSLLTFPKPEYVAVPSVDHGVCAAGDGCAACVSVCPKQAYQIVGGRVLYDKSVCEPCGRCVTACPAGAIQNPVVTPAVMRGQVEALVAAASAPLGIAYVCTRRTAGSLWRPPWFEVEVPCTGMLTATWLLAPLLMGASAVTGVPCSDSGCPLGHDPILGDRVAFARELLLSCGLDPLLVAATPAEDVPGRPLPVIDLEDPFGVHGGSEVILGLAASGTETVTPSVQHGGSPVGVIEIDPESCTLCGSCAHVCPTEALTFRQDPGELSLLFDAARCTACGQCVPGCPERHRGAISLDRAVDVRALGRGAETLHAAATLQCESCGAPIASASMMDRIAALLGDDHSAAMSYVTRFCIDCR